jgi:hypothetical protein
MTDEALVHLPPQAGSPPWRRSFALDLATRDGGDASGVFRRAEAYLAWLASAQGGESEALGHSGATNSPDVGADKGAPETEPQNGAQDGAQRAEEMVEAAAEAMHALEYPRWSATSHPDHMPAVTRRAFRDLVTPIVAAAAPIIERAVAEDLAGRLRDANDKLLDAAVAEGPPGHSWRLAAKAEGVRLALSYVEEALR